jgi:nicotinate-nucleotide adenylyltransferase
MSEPKKVALFGGTFDPVHLGHLQLATAAKESLELDEVRFLPCHISPHKLGTSPSRGEDRCEMLRLATGQIPWAVVDEFELHQAAPSYSYQTAEAMAGRFPHARLFWVMGCDQWEALPHWKHPKRLAARVEFIVLARDHDPDPREGYRLHVIHGEHPASATKIRDAIANGEKKHPWLAPAVADWINKSHLYLPIG